MREARLAPLDAPYQDDVAEQLDRFMPPGVPPLLLFRTLAHNPRVLRKFFAGSLLDRGSLCLRERELAILRTCFRCGSEYEWGLHVTVFAKRAGLSDEEVRATCAPLLPDGLFAKRDAAILRLCDALHDSADVDDALFAELSAELESAQLVELLLLAGFYHAVAFVTNALRVELEPSAARFPS
ncbi:MAG: carboxymuconolactone decarboxylase family protein [Myxococcota bacterium]